MWASARRKRNASVTTSQETDPIYDWDSHILKFGERTPFSGNWELVICRNINSHFRSNNRCKHSPTRKYLLAVTQNQIHFMLSSTMRCSMHDIGQPRIQNCSLKFRSELGSLGVDVSVIFKLIIKKIGKKNDMRLRTGFKWFMKAIMKFRAVQEVGNSVTI
jgi:hypothetical protein